MTGGLYKGAHTQKRQETDQPSFRWPSLKRLAALVLILCGITGAVSLFEYTAWHMPVDRFTFVAYNLTHDKLLANINRANAQEANALRQEINALPHLSLLDNSMGLPTAAGCAEPLYTGPIGSYRYDFFWRGLLVETVWVNDTTCAGGWVSSGGITFGVYGMPILPNGVHLPPNPPWHL